MTSSIDAKNKNARCLLKWISESLKNERVTEVLKTRVKAIRCTGDSEKFRLELVVDGGYAKKILEMNMDRLRSSLQDGFREQASVELEEISVVLG